MTYTKQTRDGFPDFLDRINRGQILGLPYYTLNKGIVSQNLNWINILNGEENPNWRDEVRRHINATTYMTATKVAIDAKKCFVRLNTRHTGDLPGDYRIVELRGYPLYSIPSLSSPDQAARSNARNQAIRKFLARANEVRTSVEGGQALGEWKETVHAITNPLGALRRFVVSHVGASKKKLRRHKRRKGKEFAKALSDTYLEFVFGWIPLAKDIQAGIAGMLDRYDQPDLQRVSARGFVSYDVSSTTSSLVTVDSIQFYQNVTTSSRTDYRITASIKTGAVNGVKSIASTFGLLPERFIPTVWELIPYSFVVDYFVNVGDIIASYAFQRCNIAWGYTSDKTITERRYSDVQWRYVDSSLYPIPYQLNSAEAYSGGATVTRQSYLRDTIQHESLMPDLDIHLPFSDKAWWNIGALLTSNFVKL